MIFLEDRNSFRKQMTHLLTVLVIWIILKLIYTCAHIHFILGFNFKRGTMTCGSHRILVHSKRDNAQGNISERNKAVIQRETETVGAKWLGCLHL